MSDEECTIRIATDELSVELEGPPGRVQQGYLSLRAALLESFETTMQHHEEPERDGAGETMPMHARGRADDEEGHVSAAVRAMTPDPPNPGASVIQLVLQRKNYTKVRLLERRELADSFLGNALDASVVGRLYASPETAGRLHDSLTIGETLWRKLTPAGRREVARRSRANSEESDE